MIDSFVEENTSGYLEFRRRFGYRYEKDVYILRRFRRHLLELKIESLSEIDSNFVMEYTRVLLQGRKPQTVNAHLEGLNNFFLYLQRMDLCEINPLSDRLTLRGLSFSPYVFSDSETMRILQSFAADVARCQYMKSFLVHLGRHCIMVILAHCGLRISEALKLQLKDVSFEEKTIFIEKTKFRKDRRIPVSGLVLREIGNYLSARRYHEGSAKSEYLFSNSQGDHYSRVTVHIKFITKMKELGIYREPHLRGDTVFGSPSPHSLRHAFAVRTVRRWQTNGLPIDEIADTLMTYLGHSTFSATQVYLKALSLGAGVLMFSRRG